MCFTARRLFLTCPCVTLRHRRLTVAARQNCHSIVRRLLYANHMFWSLQNPHDDLTKAKVYHCKSSPFTLRQSGASTRQRSRRPLFRKLPVGLLPPAFSIRLTSQEKNLIYICTSNGPIYTTSSSKDLATKKEDL